MEIIMQHVFIVGAKSLGAYGGYETFVDKLTEYHQDNDKIKYHIACKANGDGHMDESKLSNIKKINDEEFIYHNAHCFKIKVPNVGAAQAIVYDLLALNYCCRYIERHKIKNPIIYILACRIGPFAKAYRKKIHKFGGRIYVNPDGHEFLRAKWNYWIRKYWKYSEKLMVRYSDLVICDSINIEKYIHKEYDGKCIKKKNPKTTFIAYGAETEKSDMSDDDSKLVKWYKEKGLEKEKYYLVVGRFVPENNYEIMLREFMKSNSRNDFALITNVSDKFLERLKEKTGFQNDPRIKFVGTVYDQELLKKIRENAFAYFHGHEVGGTNPSLLEALGSTNLNLLLDVGFNREVAKDSAYYWNKSEGNLAQLIEEVEKKNPQDIIELGEKAKERVRKKYSWEYISKKYEKVFVR